MKPARKKPDYLDGDSDEVNGWRQYRQSSTPVKTMGEALGPFIAALRAQLEEARKSTSNGSQSSKPAPSMPESTSAESSAKPKPGQA